MKVHFTAIGGSAMHQLAIALREKGYEVTGSDDEIFEPAKSNLAKYGLLPPMEGWFPEKITGNLDAVILGMHAKADNPELVRSRELGVKTFSFPEYIYEQSTLKKRVVIGGSHGKTTITAMVMHVLKSCKMDFDYLVGAALEGFDTMVKITEQAPVLVIEGDEYLASAIDRRPKFHLYRPHIALISGIAWDHINVFPTFDTYVEQFRIFASLVPEGGLLIYNEEDVAVKNICVSMRAEKIPYSTHPHYIKEGSTYLVTGQPGYTPEVQVFGKHNLLNLEGARMVCRQLGISDARFYEAIRNFKGAAKRLQLLKKNNRSAIYRDFAHSPSKVRATIEAVKAQYPGRKLAACMELHTYSSLNADFLKEYAHTMDPADQAIVYYNAHTLSIKRLPGITLQQVRTAFCNGRLEVITQTNALADRLKALDGKDTNLLLMSSGNFDGLDFNDLPNFAFPGRAHETKTSIK